MAPLPHNNTDILFVDYNTCGHDHTAEIRLNGAGAVDNAIDTFGEVVTAFGLALCAATFISARLQLEGENVSNPVSWTGPATWGGDPGTEEKTAWFYGLIGRSLAGRRVRFYLFGAAAVASGTDYRMLPGEFDELVDALGAIRAQTDNFLAIDGATAVWKSYANTGVNAYWRNKIR